jgi:hypothetical protein
MRIKALKLVPYPHFHTFWFEEEKEDIVVVSKITSFLFHLKKMTSFMSWGNFRVLD